jgi:hypothetical protein
VVPRARAETSAERSFLTDPAPYSTQQLRLRQTRYPRSSPTTG